jgi:membrane protease subunit HflC
MMKRLPIIAAVLVLLVASQSYFIVPEGKQAVVTQFGKPVGAPITAAGPYFKLPLIQDVHLFEKRILKWDGDPNQIPTQDKKYIWVDVTARWRIKDALKFLQTVSTVEGGQSRLDDVIDSVVRDLVSSNLLVELVRSADWVPPEEKGTEEKGTKEEAPPAEDEELPKRVKLGRQMITRLVLAEASKLTPRYGIELVDVRIKRINYVETVRNSVYRRMISERKRIAAGYRSEGEGKKAEILGTMERDLQEIRSAAYRRAQELRGAADGKATAVYAAAYEKDPEFYSFWRTLDLYRSKLGEQSSLILTTDADFLRYLKATGRQR